MESNETQAKKIDILIYHVLYILFLINTYIFLNHLYEKININFIYIISMKFFGSEYC